MPRYLAASLLLSLLPLTGQTITNPSFSDNNFATFPGYASGNGGVINGWTLSNPAFIGQNPAGSSPFANNGAIPTGPNVMFIQGGATAGSNNVKTTITGLTIGTTYNVTFRVNARYQTTANLPNLAFSTDGNGPTVTLEVGHVATAANATPYRYAAFEFTATATEHQITIANTRTVGDHTLLIDDVTVAPSSGAWAFLPWTNDADSGIDSQYVYTHAVSFGSNPPVTINGVNFIGREGGVDGRFLRTDLGSTFGNRANNLTGESTNLAKDFRYGGANTGITLQNLKPNTQYVFTAYGLAFDAAGINRSATFSSSVPGSDKLSVNLNHYGMGNGIRVTYTYTTDALGTPVAISYPAHSINTWHTSGFSNREAVASTPPVRWSIQAWNDDDTSGVSPNHVYTHAIKFGAAGSFNLNGINFTGIGGANPANVALNYSSANMGGVFPNDTNNVTGYGTPLAKDFIYDGFPAVHNLSGLTPGKAYVFTLYSMGWDDGSRPAAFIGGVGEQMEILNQDQFGNNNGVRFEYAYTADATGTAKITVGGFSGDKSIHSYGISNREADAMVGVAPLITLQPVGTSIGTGSDYTLRSTAIGSNTLTYQWNLNGNPILGANSTVLQLEDVDTGDSGNYTLTVTNGVTSATSNVAALAVLENVPGIFGTGLGVDGLPLAPGATDPHYSLIVNPDDTNSTLSLVQSNIPGSWLANSATSRWIGPRTDTVAAAALAADDGEGPGTYVYRTQIDLTGFDLSTVLISGSWATDNSALALRVNGVATGLVNNTGVTFGALFPFSITTANAPGLIAGINTLDFVVNNADASAGFTGLRIDGLTAVGFIPANTAPHIVSHPQGGNGPHNGIFNLTVAASGSGPLTYQWYKGLDQIVTATSPSLVLDIDTPAVAGDYSVVVSNGVVPAAVSSVATVTVTNADPVVVDDNLITDKNTPLAIDVTFDMISNDTDADGDTLSLGTFSATSFNGGTVTENAGIITYTPAANFFGLDGFTYSVTDGWGGTSAVGSVLITVNNTTNVPPGQMTLVVSGGVATGTFTGTPGATYSLLRSTTLEPGSWSTVDTEIAPPSGAVIVEDPSPPIDKAFYRISYAQ